jgi:hypothetical protein
LLNHFNSKRLDDIRKFTAVKPLRVVWFHFFLFAFTATVCAENAFLGSIPVQYVAPGQELVLDMHRFFQPAPDDALNGGHVEVRNGRMALVLPAQDRGVSNQSKVGAPLRRTIPVAAGVSLANRSRQGVLDNAARYPYQLPILKRPVLSVSFLSP